MAACCRVYDSRNLQADCQEPGSAPEPYAWQSSMGSVYLFDDGVVVVPVQELDGACGAAVCRLFTTDWSSAGAQRAVQKARLTLTLRGHNVDTIVQSHQQ